MSDSVVFSFAVAFLDPDVDALIVGAWTYSQCSSGNSGHNLVDPGCFDAFVGAVNPEARNRWVVANLFCLMSVSEDTEC